MTREFYLNFMAFINGEEARAMYSDGDKDAVENTRRICRKLQDQVGWERDKYVKEMIKRTKAQNTCKQESTEDGICKDCGMEGYSFEVGV